MATDAAVVEDRRHVLREGHLLPKSRGHLERRQRGQGHKASDEGLTDPTVG